MMVHSSPRPGVAFTLFRNGLLSLGVVTRGVTTVSKGGAVGSVGSVELDLEVERR